MRPSTHSAICAEIQQEHQKKERRLLARITELELQIKSQAPAAEPLTLSDAVVFAALETWFTYEPNDVDDHPRRMRNALRVVADAWGVKLSDSNP